MRASWEGRAFPEPGWADRAGILRLSGEWLDAEQSGPRSWALAFRGRVEERIFELWGNELAPAAEALVLARREHLDPELRESFALSGTAHLLAISGFHVGVVVALLLGILRGLGCSRLHSEVGAVFGCWVYVLGIGAPSAAVRAGTILSVFLGARLRGQPVMAMGAVGSALLVLLIIRPIWLASIGFQLSFAGTTGLVLLRRPVAEGLGLALRRVFGRDPTDPGSGDLSARLVRGGTDGLSAGIAATLSTLPLLAWHFDRVSLIGIPATMIAAPVIAIIIPGIMASLTLSLLPGGLGPFLAGGTGLLLKGVVGSVTWVGAIPGGSVWIERRALLAGLGTGIAIWLALRIWCAGRVRASVRTTGCILAGLALGLVAPLASLSDALEVHLIDVGQGDAIALRFPSGRWLLVDAGPRTQSFDAGARRVVPYLQRHGASNLDVVVLTHPHLDHIGGAPAVLQDLEVGGILDPSVSVGSPDYLEVLRATRDARASWWPAVSGMHFRVNDAQITVASPSPLERTPPIEDPNDLSVVLLVEWGEAAILLMGDAPVAVEQRILDQLPELTVLKVGHHGSRTSTSMGLLDRTRPRVALVSSGDGNRFGHPHPIVVSRLDAAAVTTYRTDRDGDVRLTVRRDGSVRATATR